MDKRLFLMLFTLLSTMWVRADNYFSLATKGVSCQSFPVFTSANSDYAFCPFSSKQSEKSITGFSVDGSFTRYSKDYLVRIILKDTEGREHLVMETYKELNDEWSGDFSNYCEETLMLNHIKADSIKIILRGASIQLTKINYTEAESAKNNSSPSTEYSNNDEVRYAQVADIVKRINSYNLAHRKLWKAGVTKLSLKSYEEKKRIMGYDDGVSTGGLEYYADGIFEMGDIEGVERTRSVTSSSFVDNFDWREQHGKNWITLNKNQGESGYCYLFTCAACTEAMANLYYNRLLNLSLSPQELACCTGLYQSAYGFVYRKGVKIIHSEMKKPLDYMVLNGVCDSLAYPFIDDSLEVSCRSSEVTPNELVRIGGYDSISIYEDSLKSSIIKKGPLVSGYKWKNIYQNGSYEWRAHAMLMVGYGQLQVGDTIYHWVNSDGTRDGAYTVTDSDPHVGMTYWIYKNSYGELLDEARHGYMYMIHHNYQASMIPVYYMKPPLTTMNYTINDIVCEDSDGDGYYYWGIGTKPTWCPNWVPDIKDGDDSNFLKGKMYYEAPNIIGDLEIINPNSNPTLQISSNTTYSTRQSVYTHIRINSNSTLTVEDVLNLFGRVTITIDSGGELVIDGGVITNADIDFSTGGKLTIKNGGKLVMRTNTDFEAPTGALVEIENGEICKSNDF